MWVHCVLTAFAAVVVVLCYFINVLRWRLFLIVSAEFQVSHTIRKIQRNESEGEYIIAMTRLSNLSGQRDLERKRTSNDLLLRSAWWWVAIKRHKYFAFLPPPHFPPTWSEFTVKTKPCEFSFFFRLRRGAVRKRWHWEGGKGEILPWFVKEKWTKNLMGH